MFDRLNAAIQPFAPDQFVMHGENYLRSLGVTRQKAAYLVHLSTLLASGELDLAKLSRMSDADARRLLEEGDLEEGAEEEEEVLEDASELGEDEDDVAEVIEKVDENEER